MITIKDIAKKLKISPSTVSRALHNHPDISPETKQRVLNSAKELDYHPDSIAQSLKNKRTKTIGIIVPEIKNYFMASVISGVGEVAYDRGYTLMVCESNESYEREGLNIRALVSHRIAGVLISISRSTLKYDHLDFLIRRKIPLVFFDRIVPELQVNRVLVDNFQGAYNAVEHLIQSGYKHIAHLAGPQHLAVSQERLRGYQTALAHFQMPVDEKLIFYGEFNEQHGHDSVEKLMHMSPKVDAVFAVNDPVTMGAFKAIRDNGLKIPQDIAIVGFSDNPISLLIEPALTTVAQPSYQIGKNAAQLLIEQIETDNQTIPFQEKILQTQLIIRNST